MNTQSMNSALPQALSWVVTLLVSVALVLTAVRVMMTPVFLQVEYNLPGFPADPYGFTRQERLKWSQNALDYLLNPAGISFLGDLRFDNGAPVYNERELRHMVDVKRTVQGALLVWFVSLVILLGLGLLAWRGGWLWEFRQGLVRGGWLTVILLASIIIFVIFGFGVFFVAFHNVFFQAGTWTFEYSDTLIRLFPERFWRDVFILVGGLSLIGGSVLALLAGRKSRI